MYEETKDGDKDKNNYTITEFASESINKKQDRDANYEWNRLDVCAHEHVLKAFAMAVTERNSKVILLERAALGDVKSHYEAIKKQNDGILP